MNDVRTVGQVIDAMRQAVCEHPADCSIRICGRRPWARHHWMCGLCGYDPTEEKAG